MLDVYMYMYVCVCIYIHLEEEDHCSAGRDLVTPGYGRMGILVPCGGKSLANRGNKKAPIWCRAI